MSLPLVSRYELALSPPTLDDPTADLERVCRGLGERGVDGVDVPLSVAQALPGVLRESGFHVSVYVAHAERPRLVRITPADGKARNLGLAVDLGTTNVVGVLLDLETGEKLGELSATNPQVARGEDILTRIHYCLREGGLDELRADAVSCINGLAKSLAESVGAKAGDIGCVSVSGNTTMAHLFLGLDPYNICRAPYLPAANRFDFLRAAEVGFETNPEAVVYVLPNVGSYVGGDVLAGVMVSGMHGRREVSLLVDVGTNAEIVIGNSDWLMVCAGAAGPALEGGVVRFGMRAMPGAIERVKVDPDTCEPSYTVIGGARPKGLCGSALIDLLAELFTAGLIDGRGRFMDKPSCGRVAEVEGKKAYIVVKGADSATGHDIVFTETDIDNLIRTKAAMYTALGVVTRELGISFSELADFFIAGTFGAYIDAERAVTIGMVPDIDIAKYKPLGNTSLMGACEALANRGSLAGLEDIASMITYKELNVSSDFMSEFRAAMFLPHTDASLFPSVKNKLL